MNNRKNTSTLPLKTQAKALREYLAGQGVELGHGKCLEAVAQQYGFKNWDAASAGYEAPPSSDTTQPSNENAGGSQEVDPDFPSFFTAIDPDVEIGEDFQTRFLALKSSHPEKFAAIQQQYFESLLRGNQTTCKSCTGQTRLYRRKLSLRMAATFLWACRVSLSSADPDGWFHIKTEQREFKANADVHDFPKLRFWGLLEEMSQSEMERTKRGSGFMRVTELGRRFLNEEASVPLHVVLFNNGVFGHSKGQITLREVLGDRFDTEMARSTPQPSEPLPGPEEGLEMTKLDVALFKLLNLKDRDTGSHRTTRWRSGPLEVLAKALVDLDPHWEGVDREFLRERVERIVMLPS